MERAGIHHLELIILFLLLVAAALAALARRFHTPYPIVLVIGGLLLSFIPHMPHVSLRPELVFLVFLPPLLYVGSSRTSWRDFRANLTNILILAFGLVGFTVLGVALGAGWLLPGFDYRLGAVLGAVIATTDPIAATAIATRVGLPRSISDILAGEGMVNDATGLLALQFTVALMVTGQHPTTGMAILELLRLVSGGVIVGLVTGFCVHKISRRITDSPVEITFTLVTPYIAYLVAEGARASGVLAVVVCGLYLGRKNSETLSINARLESEAVWNILDFVLNCIVFILIGLQLPYILTQIHYLSITRLLLDGAAFSAFLIVLRLFWVFSGAWIAYLIRAKLLRREAARPNARGVFIVGWTGMRGVLALAAAISLPNFLASGAPFPERHLIIFLAFCVILVTLVLQGLSLPWLIRKLALGGATSAQIEEIEARQKILNTVLERLHEMESNADDEHLQIYRDIARHYRGRLTMVNAKGDRAQRQKELSLSRDYRNLSRELRDVERKTAMELRNENKINDELLRRLQRELDLTEGHYMGY